MAQKPDTRKKFFKDGNPELYKYFSDLTWKNMTAPEREMWTPADNRAPAPIPKAAIDFTEQNKVVIDKDKEIAELKEENRKHLEAINELILKNKALKDEVNQCKKDDPTCCKETKEAPKTEKIEALTEEEEIKIIREELRKLDVKFAYNAKLPNLKAKLKAAQDANNTE